MSCGKRRRIDRTIREQVYSFYGLNSILDEDTPGDGSGASLHHLNGQSCQSEFVNLVPCVIDRHMRLVLPKRGKPDHVPPALMPRPLLYKAIQLARRPHFRRAVGCARLAYAVRRYYLRENREEECEIAAHALKYLERSLGEHDHLILDILNYMLDQEILPTLESLRSLSLITGIRLQAALCYWLNEAGRSERALPFLEKLVVLADNRGHPLLDLDEYTSLVRQTGSARIQCGALGSKEILKKAEDLSDNAHNIHGVLCLETVEAHARADYTKARSIVERQLGKLYGKWEDENVVLECLKQSQVGYPTVTGALGHDVIMAVHDKVSPKDRIESERRLERIELRLGCKAQFVMPQCSLEAVLKAGVDEPFLRSHTIIRLDSQLADKLEKALRLIDGVIFK